MTSTSRIREEFYLRRGFGDDVPVFVDATRYLRQGTPYPLSGKRALKATCGVRADEDVIAFSLRGYTAGQAEREVEHLERTVGGTIVTQSDVLRLRMPDRTLRELGRTARDVSAVLTEDDVIAEFNGELYVLALTRAHCEGGLGPAAKLARTADGYVRADAGGAGGTGAGAEFRVPGSGVRLHVFLRSPVARRVIAYAFAGSLTRGPGEIETVARATAVALDSVLGLASFRMLSGLDRIGVSSPPGGLANRPREPAEPVAFTLPVLLLTDGGTPAGRGHVTGEIDLERLDPVTGGLGLRVRAGERLELTPAAIGSVRFESYQRVLAETVNGLIDSFLGADVVRDIAYDIMLGDVGPVAVAALRAATADIPGLVATPGNARVRALRPGAGHASCSDDPVGSAAGLR